MASFRGKKQDLFDSRQELFSTRHTCNEDDCKMLLKERGKRFTLPSPIRWDLMFVKKNRRLPTNESDGFT